MKKKVDKLGLPACLFKLSKEGGCVGTVHDQCKNCNKRAKAVKEQLAIEGEVDYSQPRQRKVPLPLVDVVENKETVEQAAVRMFNERLGTDNDGAYYLGFKDGSDWQQSQSTEGVVGFVFSDGEDKANITDLHLLSDIYDMVQNRLKSFSEDTIEHLSKPLKDLLLHNGVNVDDETEF